MSNGNYSVQLEQEFLTGTVKWYSTEKAYGFIIPDDRTGDVFLHGNILKLCGLEYVNEGERVRFTIGEHKGRKQAENIEIV